MKRIHTAGLLTLLYLFCILVSGRVTALEFQVIDALLNEVQRDGVALPVPPPNGYYPWFIETQELAIETSFALEMLVKAGEPMPSELGVALVAEAIGGGSTEEKILDTQGFKAGSSGMFAGNFKIPSIDTEQRIWFAKRQQKGAQIRLLMRFDPDDLIEQNDEKNNDVVLTTSLSLLPVNNALLLGNKQRYLPVLAGNLTNSIFCDQDSELLLGSAVVSWDPDGLETRWPELQLDQIALLGSCAKIVYNVASGSFDLALSHGVFEGGPLQAEQNDLLLEIETLQLSGDNIFLGETRLTLPPEHSLHAVRTSGEPEFRGTGNLNLAVPAVLNLENIQHLQLNLPLGFLQVRGMPFSLEMDRWVFSAEDFSITGNASSTFYAHNQPYALADERHRLHNGVTSNDRRFSNSVGNTAFSIVDGGLNVDLPFAAATRSARTHYPLLKKRWAGFSLDIHRGEIQGGALLSAFDQYRLRQNTLCPDCVAESAGASLPYILQATTKQGIAVDGAVFIKAETLGNNPAWGPFDPAAQQYIFQRLDDEKRSALLYLPGFLMPDTAAKGQGLVGKTLTGMRCAQALDTTAVLASGQYRVDQQQARRGNCFAAGINVGPQIYHNGALAQPEVGEGGSLDGSRMAVGFGGLDAPLFDYPINNNLGTKYVIRAAGVTGVFNTASAPQPPIYGYDFAWSRFAFRQQNNLIQEETWIDGQVHVPYPADVVVAFDNLQLSCTGDIRGGHLVPGECSPEDPDCLQTLAAWQSSFDVLSMDFVLPGGNQNSCAAGDRQLKLTSVIDPLALSKPITLTALWSAQGLPDEEQINTATTHRLDPEQGTEQGFALNLGADFALGLHENESEGWFMAGGSISVPFWNDLAVKLRAQNTAANVAAPSFLDRETSAYLDQNDLLGSDISAQDLATGDDPLMAQYTWLGGYDIDLPIYYQATPNWQHAGPQFLGITKELFDMVVMDADAGADFITPDETRVSFGASANFDQILENAVPLGLSLNDPASLLQLGNLGGFGATLLDNFGGFTGAFDFINDSSGNNFDAYIANGVRQGLGEIFANSDAIAPLVNGISNVRAAPGVLLGDLVGGLDEQVLASLTPLSTASREQAQHLILHLAPMFNNLEGHLGYGGPLNYAKQDISEQIDRLNVVISSLGSSLQSLDQVNEQALTSAAATLLNQLQTQMEPADSAREILFNQLGNHFDHGQCNSGGPVWSRIDEVRSAIGNVNEVVQQVDIAGVANALAGIGGEESDSNVFIEAGETIQQFANDLDARISEAEAVMDQAVGCAGNAAMYANFGALVDQLDSDLEQAFSEQVGVLNTLNSALETITSDFGSLSQLRENIQLISDRYTERTQHLTDLKSQLEDALEALIDGGDWQPFEVTEKLEALEGGGLDVVSSLVNEIENGVNTGIETIATQILVSLPDLDGIPPAKADEMLSQLGQMYLNDGSIGAVDQAFAGAYTVLIDEANGLALSWLDQVNHALKDAIENGGGALADLLAESDSEVVGEGDAQWNLGTFKMDGFAVIGGDDLQQMHLGLAMGMPGAGRLGSMKLDVAYDMERWSNKGKGEGCVSAEKAESLMDAVISASFSNFQLGLSSVSLKQAFLGFTLRGEDSLRPINLMGGIELDGTISLAAVDIYSPALLAAFGATENYVGARAGGATDGIGMQLGFLAGRICDMKPMLAIDPQFGDILYTDSDSSDSAEMDSFSGLYTRGSVSMDVLTLGCPARVGVGGDMGVWLFATDPFSKDSALTTGTLLGGGIYGTGACLASIRGQMTLGGGLSAGPGMLKLSFQGDTWAALGLGFCKPSGWNSISNERGDDPFCGSFDAQFGLGAVLDVADLIGLDKDFNLLDGVGVDDLNAVDVNEIFNNVINGPIDFNVDGPAFGGPY